MKGSSQQTERCLTTKLWLKMTIPWVTSLYTAPSCPSSSSFIYHSIYASHCYALTHLVPSSPYPSSFGPFFHIDLGKLDEEGGPPLLGDITLWLLLWSKWAGSVNVGWAIIGPCLGIVRVELIYLSIPSLVPVCISISVPCDRSSCSCRLSTCRCRCCHRTSRVSPVDMSIRIYVYAQLQLRLTPTPTRLIYKPHLARSIAVHLSTRTGSKYLDEYGVLDDTVAVIVKPNNNLLGIRAPPAPSFTT